MLTSKQVYDRVRRMQLKNIKRLELEGVPFVFRKNQLSLFDKNDVGGGFNIRYETSYNGTETSIRCVVTVHPNNTVPADECKNLREVYSFPHCEDGFAKIRKWYGTLIKVCELRRGDYFKSQNSNVSWLYDEEGRFTRLHDGAYCDRFFTDCNGSIENNNGFVRRCTRQQAIEAVEAYRQEGLAYKKVG